MSNQKNISKAKKTGDIENVTSDNAQKENTIANKTSA